MTGIHYEVIVVGGGPAGGTAAYELARKGVRVLVLEKERLPRYKCCAGGFPLKAARLLDLDLSSAYEMEITKGKCTYKGGSTVLMDFGKVVGWTVMRAKLDYLILEGAMKAGANVVAGQGARELEVRSDKTVVRTEGQEYSALIVVGADGANGVVARSVGLMKQRRLAVALESEIPVKDEVVKTERGCVHFDFGSIPQGYGWVFPKREHLSVGIGAFRPKATNLKAYLFNFLRKHHLPSNPDEVNVKGHLVPLGGINRALHMERVLLLGDAAGLAEPMTGEGIYYAIRSAKLAATIIYEALTDNSLDLSPYTRQINAQITRDFKYAHLLAKLLHSVPRLCFHYFAKSPMVRWAIADVLYGASSFEKLLYQPLKNSPMIMLADLRK